MPSILGQPSWLVLAGATAAGMRLAARTVRMSFRIALVFGRFAFRRCVPGWRARETRCLSTLPRAPRAARTARRAVAARGAHERGRAKTDDRVKSCRERPAPFVYRRPSHTRRHAVKYMLLIHQGTTPTPRDPEAWARLSQEEQQAVFADYKALNETPGVSPGLALDEPYTATTVRVDDGRTLTTDGPFAELKEAIGGWLIYEADDLDAAMTPDAYAASVRSSPNASNSVAS